MSSCKTIFELALSTSKINIDIYEVVETSIKIRYVYNVYLTLAMTKLVWQNQTELSQSNLIIFNSANL